MPYGFGAIICRELTIRWKKGWLSFLLLSLAYGIFEEGIVVRSFFNPDWGELGPMQLYTHYMGINWSFSFALLHFHIVFSIWSSVIFAELIYSKKRDQSWVSSKKLAICIIGLLLWIPAGWLMTPYIPPLSYYLITICLFVGLIVFALRLPNNIPVLKSRKVTSPIVFFIIGMLNVFITFFTIFVMPDINIFPPLWTVMLFLIIFNVIVLYILKTLSGKFILWDDSHRLALLSGFLSLFFFVGIVEEFEDGFTGSGIVAILTILFLIKLNYHIKNNIHENNE